MSSGGAVTSSAGSGWARRGTAVLVALAGVGLGLIVAARPLASGQAAAGGVTTGARLSATGSGLAPAYPALLLVGAAAAVALAFAGPRLRVIVAALLGAAGVGAEIAWRAGLGDAAAGLSRATMPPGLPVQEVAVSSLAWAGDIAAGVVVLGAALALAFGSRWGRGSRRYDAPTDPVAGLVGASGPQRLGDVPGGPGRPGAPGGAGGAAPGAGTAGAPGAGTAGAPGAGTAGAPTTRTPGRRGDDDWEALSRGEDPTLS